MFCYLSIQGKLIIQPVLYWQIWSSELMRVRKVPVTNLGLKDKEQAFQKV
jgi:hypothetical protein